MPLVTPPSYRQLLREFFTGRMIVAALMGFASGLPLLLTLTLLQAWLTQAGVSLGEIGLFALVGIPYTIKFLWAPFMDRYVPPLLGRRRGWLFVLQLLLALAILLLGQTDPHRNLTLVAVFALLVALFSAMQDTVIDAYRRESLADDEQGLGASLYVWGYRVGMLVASGGGLILAQYAGFALTFAAMAALMLPGLVTTLFAPEPDTHKPLPPDLRTAVVGPFVEFFSQRQNALLILLFILLYKLGDTLATTMTTPFYLELGYSKADIGAVVKLFGFWATVFGGFAGGIGILRIGQYRALWLFGLLQALSTAAFAWLFYTGPVLGWLAVIIAFENFTGGMGTAAFIGFMANLTNKEFTATQYALLTSLMGVPRTLLAASTGYMAQDLGWPMFFIVCALLAVPGLLLLTRFRGWLRPAGTPPETSP
ncbi:AmpG family muropeptide MFS transporter [Acidihalobacter prosperus]|uniref:AmpG family muropeptide MFS transporter n=1 Tax=Acidihalobacter prosperus TaxID=160660 RepID=UPI000502FADD|nr:MFS transporter [Acidihalobacter prosperus]